MTAPSPEIADAERQVKEVLAGAKLPLDKLLIEIDVLKAARRFGLGRQVLEKTVSEERSLAMDAKLRRKYLQKLALFTYKDPDLQPERKFKRALQVLHELEGQELLRSADQESLGLAGAIYKRMWEINGRVANLETALAHYTRGADKGVEKDFGYTAINAAFVADLLAGLEADATGRLGDAARVEDRRNQARALRLKVIESLPAREAEARGQWWFLVTLGEAYFGLRRYAEASEWLVRASKLKDVPDWERESTARQLIKLMKLMRAADDEQHLPADPKPAQVLSAFLGDAAEALTSLEQGKIGLALSGGGFRASLYHIGVLARLAELDLLRHVECLSCVSGGSIVGAYYYLEVRALLQRKSDNEITKQDYIAIVERMADGFLKGVEKNIRTRIGSELRTNFKMVFSPNYSRTLRAGELYESELFSHVKDGEERESRWLNKLTIAPKNEHDFRPKEHNWRRKNKVPILVLNATTLNTGHNWQFTTTWMGESPEAIDATIDANSRLRRMYYHEAPPKYRQMRLGHAVAASACVPGIFEPLALPNLYEDTHDGTTRRPMVRLVDGGVFDNQGVSTLLDQSCSILLISDASGQMMDQDYPSNGLLGVPLRSNSILQARVRGIQLEELHRLQAGGLLHGMMFVHLKQDLAVQSVDWVGCQDPSREPPSPPLTSYGVQRAVQRRLAAIRTDLDSFSETEAYALMASAYLMTREALQTQPTGITAQSESEVEWVFRKIEPVLKESHDGKPDSLLMRQLKVADKLALKVWMLVRRLQIAAGILVVMLLAFIGMRALQAFPDLDEPVFTFNPTWSKLLESGGATLVILALGAALGPVTRYRKNLQDVLIGLGMFVFGFLLGNLHLFVFDKIFLWYGRLNRLLGNRPGSARPPAATPQESVAAE